MNIFVFIPSNIFSDIPSLREKTVRIANLVRTLNLFKVRELVIFKYKREDEELYRLLNFFRTPSYLRKYAFKKDKTFRFIGVSPPIRAFYEDDKKYRYGVVIKKENNTCFINLGLKDLAVVKNEFLREGELVKLVKEKENWRLSKKDEDPHFGFNISIVDNLVSFLEESKSKENLIFATSRYGKVFTINDLLNLNGKARYFSNLYLLFGSPKEGLFEIFQKLGSRLENHTDLIFNMFPDQGVKTIRTDEAILGTLSILNLIIR